VSGALAVGDDVTFRADEMEFLRSHGIARLTTSGEDDQPDVVPVACEFDGAYFWVGGSGGSVLSTRKVSNVRAGRRKVALVVDDLPSFDPFVARGFRVYGVADGPVERVGMVGPGRYLCITPHVSWSWNMAGQPVGATWYGTRRAVHDGSASGADDLS
jgi:pyridoxamine 5'-phosphate oxidase family protein